MTYRETDHILPEERSAIYNKLWNYNLDYLEDKDPKELGVFLEDPEKDIYGALIGWTLGNWLTVEYLWVESPLRRQNLGSELLHRAESAAIGRNCKYVFLDTLSFQAPAFYEKNGYCLAFVLNDYPLNSKRYYYTKIL